MRVNAISLFAIFALARKEHFFMQKNMKKIGAGLLLASLLVLPIKTGADLPNAVSYLEAQTQDAWTTQALAAAGVTNMNLDHLKTVNGTLATDYAKTILAVTAAGQNPTTFGNIDYIAKLKTFYNSNQFGDTSLLNDDAWSILALASVGQKDLAAVTASKNYLLSKQNADGGWGYAVGGASDTNDTAAIMIALLEAGVSSSDEAMTKAIAYLQGLQNADGGWGWQTGSASDSGSDAWVITAITKLGQDPTAWQKSGKNAVEHLWSLQDSDGGFWWVEKGTSDFNNKAMTPYAVIALKNKSFPVGYFASSETAVGDNHVRIEGKNSTICDTYVIADTALAVIAKAAEKCNFSFTIEDATFGKYLKQVGDDTAAGLAGWLYFVNNTSPLVGADDYTLVKGDEVLWYYGEWGWSPTKLTVDSSNVVTGGLVKIETKYFDGQNWLTLTNATINGAGQNIVTNASGQTTVSLADGYYNLYATKDGYVRSNKVAVTVGSGIEANVGLTVEVNQGTQVAGESIIFSVSPNKLDFGKMKPGETKNSNVTLANQGTVNLEVKTNVTGDSLFTDNIKIDDQSVGTYVKNLGVSESHNATTTLSVPASYLSSGVKNGEMIFWARAK